MSKPDRKLATHLTVSYLLITYVSGNIHAIFKMPLNPQLSNGYKL